MSRFSSHEIAHSIEQMHGHPRCRINCAGGDYDSVTVAVSQAIAGDPLYVRGFVWSGSTLGDQRDDVDVDAIEVTDGLQSCGGLSSADESTCVLYGRICSMLRRAGHTVVHSMDEYF